MVCVIEQNFFPLMNMLKCPKASQPASQPALAMVRERHEKKIRLSLDLSAIRKNGNSRFSLFQCYSLNLPIHR